MPIIFYQINNIISIPLCVSVYVWECVCKFRGGATAAAAAAAARGDKMDSPAGHRVVCVCVCVCEYWRWWGLGRWWARNHGGRQKQPRRRAVIDPPMSTPRGVTNFLKPVSLRNVAPRHSAQMRHHARACVHIYIVIIFCRCVYSMTGTYIL